MNAIAAGRGPAFALLLLAALAYAPSLRNGFIWDDDAYVWANPNLQDVDGLRRIWTEPTASPQYYPLVFTTFWLEYHLWGLHPAGYHATNLVLHALSSILLWRLLRRLAAPAAWLVAAAFALHPVHVESVAWITERKNVLSGFFYLAAATAYFRFAPPDHDGPTRPAWYLAALVLFVAALLSKTVAGSLPTAILLVIWWKQGRIRVRDAVHVLPFVAVAVPLGLLTAWLEKHHVLARGPEWDLSLAERWLVAGRAVWFYAGKLVWPAPLTFVYPRWQLDPTSPLQHLYPLTAVAVPVIAWLGRRIWGRGPLVAVLYFGGTLLPALGFFDVYPMRYSFVADHFQYLASIGFLALLVAALERGITRLAGTSLPRVLAGVWLAVLGALTFMQTLIYRDARTLWTDTIEKDPSSFIAHNNLGNLVYDRGEFEEAGRHYAAAAQARPWDPLTRFNLGKVAWALGDLKTADADFRAAINLDPDYAHAESDLGMVLAQQGRQKEAIEHFYRAYTINPEYAGACYNLALAYTELGQFREALPAARRAVALDPSNPRHRALLERLERELSKQGPQ